MEGCIFDLRVKKRYDSIQKKKEEYEILRLVEKIEKIYRNKNRKKNRRKNRNDYDEIIKHNIKLTKIEVLKESRGSLAISQIKNLNI